LKQPGGKRAAGLFLFTAPSAINMAADQEKRTGTVRVSHRIALATVAFVLVVAFVAVAAVRPPAAVSAGAPPDVFSSQRAMVHLRQIAVRPHPAGSPDNARVRAYLVDQLRALGLQPTLQPAQVTAARRHIRDATGTPPRTRPIVNVLARVPGTAAPPRGETLALVCHYDSVPTSHGAGDDGAAVAALLEVARALKSGPMLRRDVLLLFTDGEEDGLLGAKAFVDGNPLARNVALVVNFEGRGTGGPALLFETSPNNLPLIRAWAKSAPHPMGNSLAYDVYKLLPNDTDFSEFRRARRARLQFCLYPRPEHLSHPARHPRQPGRAQSATPR
jgi:hypothetical protein